MICKGVKIVKDRSYQLLKYITRIYSRYSILQIKLGALVKVQKSIKDISVASDDNFAILSDACNIVMLQQHMFNKVDEHRRALLYNTIENLGLSLDKAMCKDRDKVEQYLTESK